MSIAVLVALAGIAIAACIVTRNVVDDQEHKLLRQRTDEAALYLSSVVSGVQTQLSALASAAAAGHGDTTAFERSATLMTKLPGGFATVALVRLRGTPSVVVQRGAPIADLTGPAAQAIQTASTKSGLTGAFVATPLFGGNATSRHLGFAYVGPTLPGFAVYAQSDLKPTAQIPAGQSQPFSELIAAVYAVPQARPDQLIGASAPAKDLPLRGTTARAVSHVGQGQPWLLVGKARRALVGSVATAMPWAILVGGLLTALLACAVVETLARRRVYAESQVRTRTVELEQSMADLAAAHNQLLRQERLAAIGQLASSIGHELRNPLGVISNAVYLLRGDLGANPTEPAQRHLAAAEREISAATVIVSDLLEFARQRDPAPTPVDVGELLDEVLGVLPPPTGVTVAKDVAGSVVVRADRDQLRQVMLNLISNGYQALVDGGAVTVGAAARDGSVELWVTDTGAGITPEVAERLFEPFFTTKARGIGLGLAVSRRIVEAHSGDISVETTTGEGTTFRVVLPVIAQPRERHPADADATVDTTTAGSPSEVGS